MTDYNGNVKPQCLDKSRKDQNIYDKTISGVGLVADPRRLISSVCTLRNMCVGGLQSVHRKGRVTAKDLVERLKIPIKMAKKMLRATLQLAVRTVEEPSLTRKFQRNDRILRYP